MVAPRPRPVSRRSAAGTRAGRRHRGYRRGEHAAGGWDVQEPYESLIDRQIRLAAERGDFDDLPLAGKPLPALAEPDDELWWVRGYLRREGLSTEVLLPPAVQLRKQIDRLPETLRA